MLSQIYNSAINGSPNFISAQLVTFPDLFSTCLTVLANVRTLSERSCLKLRVHDCDEYLTVNSTFINLFRSNMAWKKDKEFILLKEVSAEEVLTHNLRSKERSTLWQTIAVKLNV